MITINQNFVEKLLANINQIGISTSNIVGIYLCGSALYLDNPNDIDVKVIIKYYNNKAETLKAFNINGMKVQAHYYRMSDWEQVKDYKVATYIVEAADILLIYGEDVIYRFDVINNSENQRYLINIYDRYFWNYDENDKKAFKFKDKRLWNFLLFAFKYQNRTNEITQVQKQILQDAKDLKIDKEAYRDLFNQMKESIEVGVELP